ncbi:MAG: hypothetical protein RJB52_1204 [Pseudomonadota bacterium]|jgi:hypothetical protein
MDNTDEKENKVGAPVGNTNSSKNNRIWANTIRKLAIQEDYRRIHAIAEKLFEKAAEGDLGAAKEIGDRLDGKAVAIQEITGADGKDLPIGIGISFVKPDDSSVSE